MKTRKNLIRIGLIVLVLIVALAFMRASYANSGMDKAVTAVLGGLIGWLVFGMQQGAALIIAGIQGLMILATSATADGEGVATMGDVIFNRCGLSTINYFPEVWVGPKVDVIDAFSNSIRNVYVIVRNLTIAIQLGILLYVGIRMAISTVAEEKVKYKKMMIDWTIGIVLVFVIHYIMILATFATNVVIYNLSKLDQSDSFGDWAGLAEKSFIPGVRYTIFDCIWCLCFWSICNSFAKN